MNNQSHCNTIRLLFIALIVSLLSISFIVVKYFELIEKREAGLLNTRLLNTRPARVSGSTINETPSVTETIKLKQ